MIALASGVPLLLAVAMLLAGTVGVVLDVRRHEHRTGRR